MHFLLTTATVPLLLLSDKEVADPDLTLPQLQITAHHSAAKKNVDCKHTDFRIAKLPRI